MFNRDSALSNRHEGRLEFFIEEKSPNLVVSRMPVRAEMKNPFGTVHAGALIWLADVTATLLALGRAALGENGKGFPLAVHISTNLLSNQREGEIRAEARFVRSGKRVSVIRTQVFGEQGALLAEVTTTHIPAE